MLHALTAEQMRAVESRAVAEGVATIGELMEFAGAAVAAEVQRRVPDGRIVVCCGPGNNGGDGWVAARLLFESGRDVRVVATRAPADLPAPAAEAASGALAAGVPSALALDPSVPLDFAGASAIVDALFGFGFTGPMRAEYVRIVDAMAASHATVIAADVPSGVDADTGAVPGSVVTAQATVTFSAPKPGLYIFPGARHAGEVVVADIGIPSAYAALPDAIEVPQASDLARAFPRTDPEDHKGSRGRVCVVCGSRTYPGAAVLAAMGASRMGAGFTVAVVPESIANVVRGALPSILVRAVAETPEGGIASAAAVHDAVADADAVVVGPGLTTHGAVHETVLQLLGGLQVPLVLDADALNTVSDDAAVLRARRAPLVITPHPGEAARLLGSSSEAVQQDRVAAAAALARDGLVCLLKGARTVVSCGGRTALVLAGNAGLARAGSGDVLAGMLGTLLAQSVPAFDAAVIAAFLHGRAAEYGTRRLTTTCFTSTDIVRFLPHAVREVVGE